MRKRTIALILVLACLLPLAAARPAAAEAEGPYYIMVNRAANTVTVYTAGEEGAFTVPVRAMVCSTGRAGHATPLGDYAVQPIKKEWCLMYDGTYAQYTTAFNGDILFHSICYWAPNPAWMIADEYNLLGSVASLGCVRLQTADAKWIYDNCAPGTGVRVYDDAENPGPLGKPGTLVGHITPELDNGWDPTDPRPENPWNPLLAADFYLDTPEVNLYAGESLPLQWHFEPAEAALVPSWTSADPAVAVVQNGAVVCMGAGSTTVTGRAGLREVQCAVTVSGELLPLDDAAPGAWYYNDVRYVYDLGLMSGTGERRFAPDEPVSRAAALQVLYQLRPAGGEAAVSPAVAWYAPAAAWARRFGLSDALWEDGGMDEPVSRAELAVLMLRAERSVLRRQPQIAGDLSGFADAEGLGGDAAEALRWAVGRNIMQGSPEGLLDPDGALNRAQFAALLHRWLGA